MGKFYFHIRAGDDLVPDEEGQDFSDAATARREAEESARELLADAIKRGKKEISEAFVIVDEQGREIDTVSFATVLPKALKK